jgi:hypothetical protein
MMMIVRDGKCTAPRKSLLLVCRHAWHVDTQANVMPYGSVDFFSITAHDVR